jgi:hypothetical protein
METLLALTRSKDYVSTYDFRNDSDNHERREDKCQEKAMSQ